MKVLKSKHNFLHDVGKLGKRERKKYLNECSNKCIHTICEAVHNALKGSCKNTKCARSIRLKQKLKKELKNIADPSISINLKRELLSNSQTGDGIFSIIATTVLPFLLDLITGRKK
jgi:hypothetical protein